MRQKKVIIRGILIIAACAVILAGAYQIGRRIEMVPYGAAQVRGTLTEEAVRKIEFDGQTYVYNKQLMSVLFIGVDRGASTPPSGFRNGGQADFLALAVFDAAKKTVSVLQIDRDTIADITILGVLGNPTGTRKAQICLSHGFGDGGAQSSTFTKEAVERLLCGVEIDHYVTLNLMAIPALNDAVGGVSVTLEDDFSAHDRSMTQGATVTLRADQAELFVRYRLNVGDGSNQSRMRRQRVFMNGFVTLLAEKLHGDANFIGALYDILGDDLQTDMRRGKIINEGYKARDYQSDAWGYLPGLHTIGADGFVEFHADEKAVEGWVIDTFCVPAPS